MCIYVCLKGFLADLSYGDLYLTNHPFLKATMKFPCQEICEIPSILCFWKEQLTVTNAPRVLFWSPFPLLWLDRADFALESWTAVVDLAVALMVLKHYEAWGLAPVHILQAHGWKSFCPKELAAVGRFVKSGQDLEGGEGVVLGTETPI